MLRVLSAGRNPVHPIRFGMFILALALWVMLAVVLGHQEGPARPARAAPSSATTPSLAEKATDSELPSETADISISHEQLFGHRARADNVTPTMTAPESVEQASSPVTSSSRPLNLTLLGVYLRGSPGAPGRDDSLGGAALILDNDTKNRRLVRVGEQVGQWTLTRMTKRQITFTHEGQESHVGFLADTPTASSHPPTLAPSPPP